VRVPRVSELDTYRPDIVTEIRASDGTTIARYAIERRIVISRAEIPAVVRNAIVATEDKNFFRHGGVDLARTVSAMASDVRQKRYAQGGSTLTQQLARRLFLSPRKTLSRKINEYLVSFEMERRYSKDQILTLYANEIYLGHGNYGFEGGRALLLREEPEERDAGRGGAARRDRPAPGRPVPFRNLALARARRSTALRGCVRRTTSPRPSARPPTPSPCLPLRR
jgi:penicillin-binding protein 1A